MWAQPWTDLYINGIQRESFLPAIDLIMEKFIVKRVGEGIDYRKHNVKFIQTIFQ